MGFFNRFSDILAANMNDILDRMEDPGKMIKQIVREMESAVASARADLVRTIAHERRIEKEIAAYKRKIEEWEARAVDAVKSGREDLARRALELKIESRDLLAALEPELKNARQASDIMRTQYRALQAKLSEARRKQTALGARARTAGAGGRVAAGVTGKAAPADAFGDFERMEDKVAQAEAEVEAALEIGGGERAAQEEFERWESSGQVDAALAELKARVDGAPA